MNLKRAFATLTVAAACVLPVSAAQAQVLSWNIAGPGSLSSSSSGTQSTLGYSLNREGYDPQSWYATATAENAGDYSFSWNYSGYHAYFETYAELDAGNVTQANSSNLFNGGVGGGFNVNGTYTFANVQAGDVLQWTMVGSNFDSDNRLIGTLQLDQTSETATTPEPASIVLLGSGLFGVLAVARRRRTSSTI